MAGTHTHREEKKRWKSREDKAVRGFSAVNPSRPQRGMCSAQCKQAKGGRRFIFIYFCHFYGSSFFFFFPCFGWNVPSAPVSTVGRKGFAVNGFSGAQWGSAGLALAASLTGEQKGACALLTVSFSQPSASGTAATTTAAGHSYSAPCE